MILKTINRRYKVLKRVSKSAMSYVFKVQDLISGKILALKASYPCFDSLSRLSLSKEYILLSQCQHPRIVEAFQFDIAWEGSALYPGTLFFTMEYLKGMSLQKLKLLDHHGMVKVLFQILEALRWIHSKGFIYGDLKPHNIMCLKHNDGRIDIKLFDFGLVMREGHRVDGREVSGTITYLSPEMLRGAKIDRRTDFYSLGVMIYELTTGRPPFPKKDIISIAQGHLFEIPVNPIDINPSIPEPLNDLILKLLQKDPDRRFQDGGEIVSFLEKNCQKWVQFSLADTHKIIANKRKAGRSEFLKISEKPSPSAFHPPSFPFKKLPLFSFKN